MPQQINLCSTTLQKARQQFEADTMALALGVFVLLGGALCASWVWNLQSASQGFAAAMQTQTLEMQSLQTAIDRSKAMAQPPSPELLAMAQEKRADIEIKTQALLALQQGQFKPGYGHSDRLALVARSIPDTVWVTEVRADSARMEVSGMTLEPAALNEWVNRLAMSPLMQGLRLATVKVQAASPGAAPTPGAQPATAGRDTWTFNLVSAQPKADVTGGKP